MVYVNDKHENLEDAIKERDLLQLRADLESGYESLMKKKPKPKKTNKN